MIRFMETGTMMLPLLHSRVNGKLVAHPKSQSRKAEVLSLEPTWDSQGHVLSSRLAVTGICVLRPVEDREEPSKPASS